MSFWEAGGAEEEGLFLSLEKLINNLMANQQIPNSLATFPSQDGVWPQQSSSQLGAPEPSKITQRHYVLKGRFCDHKLKALISKGGRDSIVEASKCNYSPGNTNSSYFTFCVPVWEQVNGGSYFFNRYRTKESPYGTAQINWGNI